MSCACVLLYSKSKRQARTFQRYLAADSGPTGSVHLLSLCLVGEVLDHSTAPFQHQKSWADEGTILYWIARKFQWVNMSEVF